MDMRIARLTLQRSRRLSFVRTTRGHGTKPVTDFHRAPLLSSTRLLNRAARLNPPSRHLHTTSPQNAGIMPKTQTEPEPKAEVDSGLSDSAASISMDDYHLYSDRYIESLLLKLETLQEEREDVDVDFSAGVLNISLPPAGVYVLNKQPPNKQIWLSSPISGPKRFDWVVLGESMHQKEGRGVGGDWVYLRDQTTLSDLLRRELGVTVETEGKVDEIV